MTAARILIGSGLIAAALLGGPRAHERSVYAAQVVELTALARERAAREEVLREARELGPQAREVARRLREGHVGAALPALLKSLSEVATRAHLEPSAVLVLPPVRVDVEYDAHGPAPWVEEYPVQISVPGARDALLAYTEALGKARLPLRIDWVRLQDGTSATAPGVVLQVGLRLLVPATHG